MIVTSQTPKYTDLTVEEGGCLLDEADVVDVYSTGVKISVTDTLTFDTPRVELAVDTLNVRPTRAYLTPADAEHLAALLTQYAKAARS